MTVDWCEMTLYGSWNFFHNITPCVQQLTNALQ